MVKFLTNSATDLRLTKFAFEMTTTEYLLSTKANRTRLLDSIAQDKRTSKAASKKTKVKPEGKNVKY